MGKRKGYQEKDKQLILADSTQDWRRSLCGTFWEQQIQEEKACCLDYRQEQTAQDKGKICLQVSEWCIMLKACQASRGADPHAVFDGKVGRSKEKAGD